ncbi:MULTISPECIES: hypothetical protein [unclassified Mesorhizobium]|uniref:hypothetical protein n=1 Tax=unclassified Mesorhizobium TaxID=325217 RepID=UPI000F74EA8C|nr:MULTISPECIES: hypothetical protein [unclassified Mesorhizobium]AZO65624.1 hypothetical protein EJ075_12025 [Mesorhizobium sp. M6A.T.Cr.TU.016.01.1.1]RUU98148.1 hypothetical protein EOB36_24615 [Mesorhizobium sp. M6A.T.Cr.TU.017.01.1.1]RWP00390.1 MAG: hypothetical protein EOQ98_10875 [Mesorhizobium sp.]RWP55054.1 MAG: hypothetical protein EOR06_08160 [Mesorhizobium sp.]RWQ43424.1 MAG: hypothetical protein EOS21_05115 [Mesorhizobium sp.]
MSDILIRRPDAMEPVTRPGIIRHRCQHPGCAKNAGWSFAKPRQTPHWLCFEHRANAERYL